MVENKNKKRKLNKQKKMYVRLVIAPVEVWQVRDIMLLAVWDVSSSTKPAWVLSECVIILDLTASKSDRNLRTVQPYFAASHLCFCIPAFAVGFSEHVSRCDRRHLQQHCHNLPRGNAAFRLRLLSWDPWLCFGSFLATLDAGVKIFFSWFTPVRIRHPSAARFDA